jgi:hypothetical protein
METIRHISKKEYLVWKIIGIVCAVVYGVGLFQMMFLGNDNRFLGLGVFGAVLIGILAQLVKEYRDKDVAEIRKRLFWTAVCFFSMAIIAIPFFVFFPLKIALVSCVTIVFVPIAFRTIFKKKMRNSTGFLHYLADEKPGLFYKDIFNNNYLESILAIFFIVVCVAGIIIFAIWGSIPNAGN